MYRQGGEEACADCGRTFAAGRLESHQRACRRVFLEKRPVFNTKQQRVEHTAMAVYIDPDLIQPSTVVPHHLAHHHYPKRDRKSRGSSTSTISAVSKCSTTSAVSVAGGTAAPDQHPRSRSSASTAASHASHTPGTPRTAWRASSSSGKAS
ncbi:unnamed protein product [Chrysoparadoxa australica]